MPPAAVIGPARIIPAQHLHASDGGGDSANLSHMLAPWTATELQAPDRSIRHDPAAAALLASGLALTALLAVTGLPAWWVTPLAAGAAAGLLAQRPR